MWVGLGGMEWCGVVWCGVFYLPHLLYLRYLRYFLFFLYLPYLTAHLLIRELDVFHLWVDEDAENTICL